MAQEFEVARKPAEREGVLFPLIKNGKFLAELRVKKSSGFYGHYRIPGGEIEDGELPVVAVFRETFEETAVTEFSGEVEQLEPDKSLLFWLDENEADERLTLASSRLVLTKAKQLTSAGLLKG